MHNVISKCDLDMPNYLKQVTDLIFLDFFLFFFNCLKRESKYKWGKYQRYPIHCGSNTKLVMLERQVLIFLLNSSERKCSAKN